MTQRRRLRIGAVVAVTSVLAAASAWAGRAPAALRQSSLAGTDSCATSQGSLQITAFAHRPSIGYAGAFVFTGFPNTPATIHLLGVQTNTSKVTVDTSCSRRRNPSGSPVAG